MATLTKRGKRRLYIGFAMRFGGGMYRHSIRAIIEITRYMEHKYSYIPASDD